ncbi:hypothetical protein [Robbsia sp. KACC 23696]|uniref:TerC family protein n=1 Tax=Robbsia sp. KACC 23696 TaxID=3149231 RepID=UPI00325AFBEF
MMTFPLHAEVFTLGGVHWASVVQLLILDLTLGLNNIVGIAPICAAIPPGERRRVLLLACVGAFVLRVTMLSAAQLLTLLPHLSLLAGVYLCYLGYRLVVDQRDRKTRTLRPSATAPHTRWYLARRIVAVDAALSIDNVAALAAAAHALLGAGVALAPFAHPLQATAPGLSALLYCALAVAFSIPIVMASAVALAPLLNRTAWLTWIGAGLLVWSGLSLATSDPWCHVALRWLAHH